MPPADVSDSRPSPGLPRVLSSVPGYVCRPPAHRERSSPQSYYARVQLDSRVSRLIVQYVELYEYRYLYCCGTPVMRTSSRRWLDSFGGGRFD